MSDTKDPTQKKRFRVRARPGQLVPDDVLIWRMIRDMGGYWNAPDIAEMLDPKQSTRRVAGSFQRLLSRGAMKRREQKGHPFKYGVTGSCTPPQGESLVPIDHDPANDETLDHGAIYSMVSLPTIGNCATRLAPLTEPQVMGQVNLAGRLLSVAVQSNLHPDKPDTGGLPIDLALHALLTAFMSLADAYELHTERAANMAAGAYVGLQQAHATRLARAPQSIQ